MLVPEQAMRRKIPQQAQNQKKITRSARRSLQKSLRNNCTQDERHQPKNIKSNNSNPKILSKAVITVGERPLPKHYHWQQNHHKETTTKTSIVITIFNDVYFFFFIQNCKNRLDSYFLVWTLVRLLKWLYDYIILYYITLRLYQYAV